MLKKISLIFYFVILMASSAFADDFRFDNKVYREKITTLPNGQTEKKRDLVVQAVPGEELIGHLSYEYLNNTPNKDAVFTLPLAKEFIYVPGSATDEKYVWFSADNGKTYARLKDLKVRDKNGAMVLATAKDITHLQWRRANDMQKGEKGILEYHVIIR